MVQPPHITHGGGLGGANCESAGLQRETLAQVFSWEFCEISKNTFFYRTPPVAASMRYFNPKYSVMI